MSKHTLRGGRRSFPAGNILWGRMIVWGSALVAMFVIGFIFGASGGDGVSKGSYDALQKQYAEESSKAADLQAQLAAAEAATQEVQAQNQEAGADGATTDSEGSETGQMYTIQSGDTYWGIADKFYDDGSLYPAILEANGLTKDDPVTVGMELRIPPESEINQGDESGSTSTDKNSSSTPTTNPD